MLTDPLHSRPVLEPIFVSVLSFRETYAEKFRAAITRRDPAIRDYYDIDYAVRLGKLVQRGSSMYPVRLPAVYGHTST